jgi:hypothetical protein
VVRFEWYAPQAAEAIVAVPADWTDEEVEADLENIYAMGIPIAVVWRDQESPDPIEGTHELHGTAPGGAVPDMVYPPDDEEDDEADGG